MTPSVCRVETIEAGLRALFAEGDVYEVRIPRTPRSGVVSGYFDNAAAAAREIAKWDGRCESVYVTLNPVKPDLLARSANRMKERAKSTTTDPNILRRRWLLIDADPVRPAGISSSQPELVASGQKARAVKAFLEGECGWPPGILAASGNGAHVLYRIDLPNDPNSRDLVKRVLVSLAGQFDDEATTIDTSVHNAARIAKVPGTMACKGDDVPMRPHRRSQLIEVPDDPVPVSLSALMMVAGPPEEQGGNGHNGNGYTGAPFDLEGFFARYGIEVRRTKEEARGTVWELAVCPFNAEHDHGEAYVCRSVGGTLYAGCQHQSCFKSWAELRELCEPGYKEKQKPRETPREPEWEPFEGDEESCNPEQMVAEYKLTWGGNAQRFAAQHRDRVMSVHYEGSHSRLFVFDGRIYGQDQTLLRRLANETVRELYIQAGLCQDAAERKTYASHARRSDTPQAKAAMLQEAEAVEELEVSSEEVDADPYRLAVQNGIVDLHTGELSPHSPAVWETRIARGSYRPDALCPTWLAHLGRVFDGDDERVGFLQRLYGYALTGLTVEQVFVVFYGLGANGKSVTVKAMVDAAGTYGSTADFKTFVVHGNDKVRDDVARLKSKRIIAAFEPSSSRKSTLDEATIKQMTGGDRVVARKLYGEHEEWTPEFTILMVANHRPRVPVDDYAMQRRALLIPFDFTIPEGERDPHFHTRLDEERDGILSWGVEGAVSYLRDGLNIPDSVTRATQEYRDTMDPFYDFRELLTVDDMVDTSSGDLRARMVAWAKSEGLEPMSSSGFGQWLGSKVPGAKWRKASGGKRVWNVKIEGTDFQERMRTDGSGSN